MKLNPAALLKDRVKEIWREKILPEVRERFWDPSTMKGGPEARKVFESWEWFFKLSRVPFLKDRLPEFNPKKSNISWLPINQNIEGAAGIALPEEVLGRLIDKASHRVIVSYCGCRKAMGCKDYPHDIGCLMMGESALQIPEKARREVGPDEAKAHVRRGVEAGLIPIVGKARIDNDIFMIPDEGKLLTVCLCCECCCVTRFTRHIPADKLKGMHHPVEGLSISVNDECIGCGECVEKCYIGAISVKNGQAEIGELCRLCGRCVAHCPQDAVKLRLDNPNAVEDVVRRIDGAVDF